MHETVIHSTFSTGQRPTRLDALRRVVRRVRDRLEHRAELREMRRELGKLDEHILRDIGLRREDLIRDPELLAAERRAEVDKIASDSGYRSRRIS